MPLVPTEQPVLAHFHHPLRQHVLQKAAQKPECRQSTGSHLLRGAIALAKCDAIVVDSYNPVVRECHAEDVGCEILQRRRASADRTTIYYPGLAPRLGRHLGIPLGLPQCRAQLGPKQARQRLNWH